MNTEESCVCWGGGGMDWEIGINIYTAAAAADKSLQSCQTLCDPRDGSPPGSPIPGIPCVKQTTNKNRWYSTGNSTQCSVVT